MKVKLLSRVRLLAILWTAAHQAPLHMGFFQPSNILTWATHAKHTRGNQGVYGQVFAFVEGSIVGELEN